MMIKQQTQPTPRSKVVSPTTQELLQKLMKKKSKVQLIDITEQSNDKCMSKSPCSGWQSFRNWSNEKGLNKMRHQSNEDLQKTLKKPCHLNHTSSMIGNKTLECKIDQLAQQVSKLKEKSEELEQQNKVLFDSLQKYKCEGNQERNVLLERLDQMIEMQQKQEENLSYFKQFFGEESRRIKTQQSQPKLRTFGKSAYFNNK